MQPMRLQPVHPKFTKGMERRQTFEKDWPVNLPVSINTLIMEGLFYTGKSDWIVCFSCGSGFKNLKHEDNILKLHIKTFSTCDFLQQTRPIGTIRAIMSDAITFDTRNKLFAPEPEDFRLDIHSELIQDLQLNLGLLKTKYRTKLDKMAQTITSFRTTVRDFRLKQFLLTSENQALKKEIEHLTQQIECHICMTNTIDRMTSCGHGYCHTCVAQLTHCSKCRSIISLVYNVFL